MNKNDYIDVLCIGDAMVDLITVGPCVPPRGGNIWSSAVQMSPGGTVANVCVNMAKLGINTAFAGCMGSDPYGKYSLEKMQESGVNTANIEITEDVSTGIILALIDTSGERTFIACAKGSSFAKLSQNFVKELAYQNANLVHTSGVCLVEEPSRSSILLALKLAREAGRKVYYDPNLRLEGNVFPELLRKAQQEAMKLTDVLLVGEEELALMYENETNLENVVSGLLDMGIETVVVKQGEHGASAFTKFEQYKQPAYEVEVTDTTGAGDSFDAGFMAAVLRGLSLTEAVKYACAVAAIKVSRYGARAVPTHEETLAFLEARG